MSNGSNPTIFPDEEHFDGTNYAAFRDRVMLAARSRGAKGYLDGTIVKPTTVLPAGALPPEPTEWASRHPTEEEWDIRDAWTLALIVYNTKNPVGLGIKMDGSAADAWAKLATSYGTVSDLAAAGADKILRTTEFIDGIDFLEHIKDLRTKWKSALDKGAKIDDTTFRSIVLSSLPESWNTIVASVHNTTTSEQAIAALTVHWDRLKSQKPKSSTALLINTKPKLVCTNPNCRRTGHSIENCYWRGGGKEGQFPPNFRSRARSNGATGTQNDATPNNNTNTPPQNPTVNVQLANATPAIPQTTYALAARINPSSNQTQTTPLFVDPYIPTFADSGASDHCFVNKDDFVSYEPFISPKEGSAAPKGASFQIVGRGTVRKTLRTSAGDVNLLFHNALHTPELSANLISINKFDNAGFTIIFGGGKARFRDPQGREILIGSGAGGMYRLNVLENYPKPHAMISSSARTPSAPISLWHRRFGHASTRAIRNVAHKDLVNGLVLDGNDDEDGICEDCLYGKQVALPYNAEVEPEEESNECVHIDLWGPASTLSLGGAVYLMIVVDGATSHVTGYFLNRKDAATTLDAFTSYHAMSERQTGRKLLKVRADAGSEWINNTWTTYLTTHGILLKVTTPYAHAQNGLAERTIRTIIEGVRCMLAESGLPKSLWAEAAGTAIYIRNRIPSARHPNQIPEEAFTGKRQRVDHLRPFGCIAFAKVPEELVQSKLDPRAVKYVMVGYADNGYRLYDRTTRTVVTSRDVVFDEGVGHRSLTNHNDIEDTLTTTHPPTPPNHTSITRQHIAPRIRPTDPPLHEPQAPSRDHDAIDPARAPIPPISHIPRSTPALADVPRTPQIPDTRRSSRIPRPTTRLIEARASTEEELRGRKAREEWAIGDRPPLALLAGLSITSDDGPGSDTYVPKHYGEAMRRPDLWGPAMDVETKVMKDRGVFELIDRGDVPEGKKVIGSMWVYANKYDAEGNIVRRKARIVAKGYSQVLGEDFNETYAAVVRLESLRISAAVAAHLNLHIWQIDFVSAYLNSIPEFDVYMHPPPGYPDSEGKVCRLKKTLYGMMQGGHDWWHTLDKAYSKLGYTTSRADSCVRVWRENDELTITNTFTDDVFGLSTTPKGAECAKFKLSQIYEIKDLGEPSFIVGMAIERDDAGSISLSQSTYLQRVLEKFGMSECTPQKTPLPSGIHLTESMAPQSDGEREFMRDKPYRSLLGALMWAQVATRPDLSYAVGLLARFQTNPGPAHWKALLHVLAYVKGSLDYKLTYYGGDEHSIAPCGYVDADFGGDLDTRRSTSGYVFMMSGGAVSWSSKRQPTVALSATEAEYMAMTRGAQQGLWMYNFLMEVTLPQSLPITLFVDNTSAIALAKSTKGHPRAKHIDIKHHYIRERVQDGEIDIKHIPTHENIADIFTKPLPRILHEHFVTMMGLNRVRRGEC